MNEDINVNVKTLRPLTKLIYTIGELPSSYLMSMTYEEQLVWFCNYLATQVIPTVNNNGEAVSELQNLYIELQNYVNEYFNNLDLQEEVSIKVDELVENGTITSLIEQYMTPYITEQDDKIEAIETKVNSIGSGSPIPVSSTDDMTDTTRTYVNTTDGKWYYYDGDSWEIGGTYQATQVGENAVSLPKLTNDLKDILNIGDYFQTKGWVIYGSFGSYNVTNNKIVLTSSSNHTRIRGINIPIKNGDVIKFNNVNSAYKCALTFTDSDENVLLHKSLGDYNPSTYNNFLVNIPGVKYFNFIAAYDDNTTIPEDDTKQYIFGLISIVSHNSETIIPNNSIDFMKLKNCVKSNNIVAMDYVPFNYGATNKVLLNVVSGNLPQSLIAEIDKNTTYYIKTYDNHNRFTIIALEEYPYFPITDYSETQQAYCLSDENIINTDNTLSEFVFENTNFKYLIVLLNTTTNPTFPRTTISKVELNDYEEFKMVLPNLKYSIPETLSREVYFTETQYTSCEMQGCCTDGTYLYYCMHDSNDTDNGVLGKINLSNGELVTEVKNHPYGHVNAICYYNNKLYIASASDPTNTPSTIYIANTGDLSYEGSIDLESKLKTAWENYAYGNYRGIQAIGFSDELNKFVVVIRKNSVGKAFRGFAIMDTNWNLEKLIKFYPDNIETTLGGIDCDDKYIYVVLAQQEGTTNYYDTLQIYDYNGNLIKSITLKSNPRDYIEGITKIGNIFYTSNATNKICKYTTHTKEDISIGDILINYNFN